MILAQSVAGAILQCKHEAFITLSALIDCVSCAAARPGIVMDWWHGMRKRKTAQPLSLAMIGQDAACSARLCLGLHVRL